MRKNENGECLCVWMCVLCELNGMDETVATFCCSRLKWWYIITHNDNDVITKYYSYFHSLSRSLPVWVSSFFILQIDIYYEGWEQWDFQQATISALSCCVLRVSAWCQNRSVNAIPVICLNSCIKVSTVHCLSGNAIQYKCSLKWACLFT